MLFPESYRVRVKKSIAERGVLKSFLIAYYECFPKLRFGIDTSEIIELKALNIENKNLTHGKRYEGVNFFIFRKLIKQLPKEFLNSAFVDFGCGKGRALVFASHLGFKKVIGVEFSKTLCEICERNLKDYSMRKNKNISSHIVNADAAEFEDLDYARVFFFFNPFNEVILRKVITNINKSIERNRRKVCLIYINALHKDVLAEFGFEPIYSLQQNFLNIYLEGGCYLYENKSYQ